MPFVMHVERAVGGHGGGRRIGRHVCRVDATGTRRRLQALMATGWAPELLAAELGRRPHSLHRSMTGRSVTARTAHEVASLYERLVDHR
jgi:hypothetical protein